MSKSNTRTVINPFKPLINKLPQGIRNRYYLVLLVFCLFILFFDKANIFAQFRLQRAIKRLEADKTFYEQKLLDVEKERLDMENNKEKFAREHYFMKAADEDVFIIEKADKK